MRQFISSICKMNEKNKIIALILCLIISIAHGEESGQMLYPESFSVSNSSCIIQQQNNATSMNLGICQQLLFYITVEIGTPPQTFNLQVSTGNNFIWLQNKNMNLYGFNSSLSSTFIGTSNPGNVSVGNGGLASGLFGFDIVSFVNTSINVNSSILVVNNISSVVLPEGVVGVLGLGYNSSNFLDLAHQNKQISTNIFSLSLGNTPYMMYNQLPQTLLSNSLYSDFKDNGAWQLQLLGLNANQTDLSEYAAEIAIIDSGSPVFQINTQLFTQLNKTFFSIPSCNSFKTRIYCDCNAIQSLPNITFIFIGVSISITPQQYTQPYEDKCYINIYEVDTDPSQITLGVGLFSLYNITFNKQNNTIGFEGNTQLVIQFGTREFIFGQIIMVIIVIILLIFTFIVVCCMLCINPHQPENNTSNNKYVIVPQINQIKQRLTQDISSALIVRTYVQQ